MSGVYVQEPNESQRRGAVRRIGVAGDREGVAVGVAVVVQDERPSRVSCFVVSASSTATGGEFATTVTLTVPVSVAVPSETV